MLDDTTFMRRWQAAVERKNSVLCAGVDPAPFEMGRGEEGLAAGTDQLEWAYLYVQAVAPFVAAIKPNTKYWKGEKGRHALTELAELAQDLGLAYIEDAKLADIGATNDAGMFFSSAVGGGAVTLAPYAGNMQKSQVNARKRELELITMCLMSNPEYKREKNAWVPVSDTSGYIDGHTRVIDDQSHVRRYMQLAHDARKFGLTGIVVGAPSETNHITEYEVQCVAEYIGDELLVLCPGVGKQGGQAGMLWKYMKPSQVMVNVGRKMMFPNGSNSSIDDHKRAAQHYRDMLNQARFENRPLHAEE